jgi:hypothetical protein
MSGVCDNCFEHPMDCECMKIDCSKLKPNESVDHPDHYMGDGIEVIDVIEGFGLGFNLGNAIKYILRAGKKGDWREDLQKAAWYIEREIAKPDGSLS